MIRYHRTPPARLQIAPWRPAGLRSPSQLGTAGAGSLIGAIINGAVAITMATIQIAMTMRAEAAADREWRHEQSRIKERMEAEARRVEEETTDLAARLDAINDDTGVFPIGGMFTGLSPYTPYILAGVAGLGLVIVLKRRKKS